MNVKRVTPGSHKLTVRCEWLGIRGLFVHTIHNDVIIVYVLHTSNVFIVNVHCVTLVNLTVIFS